MATWNSRIASHYVGRSLPQIPHGLCADACGSGHIRPGTHSESQFSPVFSGAAGCNIRRIARLTLPSDCGPGSTRRKFVNGTATRGTVPRVLSPEQLLLI